MTTHRIPVEDGYVAALGRAVYVFSYLEWAAIWTGEVLQPGFIDVAQKNTAGRTAQDLIAIINASGRDPQLIRELLDTAEAFKALVESRNDLIHATPHTAADGEQRLLRQRNQTDWTVDRISETTAAFEALAIRMNGNFHSRLKVTVQG